MMDTLAKAQWSVEAYHQMIEAGSLGDRSVELIGGEIVTMSPEGPIHRFINHRASQYLRLLLGEHAEVIEAHPITLADSEPEPDIAVVRSPDTLYVNRHPSPEDIYWLIEIADTTLAKDLGIKKQVYARAGISEYWIVDIPSQTLKIFQNPESDSYQLEREYTEGVISPLAFPALKISVLRLLGKKDS
jgi:Uma2 family endonuclease